MTKESIDEAIKQAIATALVNHRPKTDLKVIATIVLSAIGLLVVQSNRLAVIEERQNVNSGLILKLAAEIEKVDALERNNEAAISQTAQELHDHKDIDNERWMRVGGKKEHQ